MKACYSTSGTLRSNTSARLRVNFNHRLSVQHKPACDRHAFRWVAVKTLANTNACSEVLVETLMESALTRDPTLLKPSSKPTLSSAKNPAAKPTAGADQNSCTRTNGKLYENATEMKEQSIFENMLTAHHISSGLHLSSPVARRKEQKKV